MNDLTAAREYFVTFPTDREDRLIVARTPKDAAREVFTTVPEPSTEARNPLLPVHHLWRRGGHGLQCPRVLRLPVAPQRGYSMNDLTTVTGTMAR